MQEELLQQLVDNTSHKDSFQVIGVTILLDLQRSLILLFN